MPVKPTGTVIALPPPAVSTANIATPDELQAAVAERVRTVVERELIARRSLPPMRLARVLMYRARA